MAQRNLGKWPFLALAFIAICAARAQPDDNWGRCEPKAGTSLQDQIKACTQVIARKGQSSHRLAIAHFNRGWARNLTGRQDLALQDFDRAISLEPDFEQAFRAKGDALRRRGQLKDAIGMFTRALAIKPDYAGAFAERGVAYGMLGKTEQALADFDQAITLLPDVAGFYFVRAQALERSGALGKAIADLDKAIERDPRVATFFTLRGRINAALGRHDLALADFSHALELDPSLTGASRWIQKLRPLVASLREGQGDKPASPQQAQAKAAPALEKMKPLKLLWPLCGKAHPYRGTPSRVQPMPSLLIGTPKAAFVHASEAGFVTNVEPVAGGSILELSHRDGTSTSYGRLSIAYAQFGDLVAAGQVIGQVARSSGNEGLAFVVYRDGQPVAPLTLLPPTSLCKRQTGR